MSMSTQTHKHANSQESCLEIAVFFSLVCQIPLSLLINTDIHVKLKDESAPI